MGLSFNQLRRSRLGLADQLANHIRGRWLVGGREQVRSATSMRVARPPGPSITPTPGSSRPQPRSSQLSCTVRRGAFALSLGQADLRDGENVLDIADSSRGCFSPTGDCVARI